MSQITKRALAASLKSLLEKTTLDKITIKDIVDACGINRQTFYYHFQDVYSLLDWIFVTEAERVISENKLEENWKKGLLAVFKYLTENKQFIINTYRSIGRESLEQYLYKAVFEVILDIIEKRKKDVSVSDSDKKFIADFYKYAFVGMALEWIRTGMKEEPAEIVDHISRFIEGDMMKPMQNQI
jgi:probable dihydroxyacetone kinase regulator